jgi:hypothetical protein
VPQALHGIACQFTLQNKLEGLDAVVQVHLHWRLPKDVHAAIEQPGQSSAHAICVAAKTNIDANLTVPPGPCENFAQRSGTPIRQTAGEGMCVVTAAVEILPALP